MRTGTISLVYKEKADSEVQSKYLLNKWIIRINFDDKKSVKFSILRIYKKSYYLLLLLFSLEIKSPENHKNDRKQFNCFILVNSGKHLTAYIREISCISYLLMLDCNIHWEKFNKVW